MPKPLLLAAALFTLLCACRESPQTALRRASEALYEKKPHDALIWYRKALDELEKDQSPEAPVLRARALRGAADVYYLELRDTQHAVEVYRELIARCPDAPETLEGRIHLADLLRVYKRDLKGAIAELSAAIARNPPQSAELSYQVAKLYFELGDYQQAEVEAKNVARKFETSPFVDDALLLQAQALSMMEGRRAEASKAFEDLAARFPESDLQPHALFEFAKLLAEAGENDKAIELWVRSLARHPDPSLVQSHIARVRRRIAQTTPAHIGDQAAAFDHAPTLPRDGVLAPPVEVRRHRTSVEAAGGTAEEAARDRGD